VNKTFSDTIDEIGPSLLTGGRYNPPAEFGVLYLTSSPECARREKLKQFFDNIEAIPPQVVGRFQVNLPKCLDLTNTKNLELLKLSRQQLIDPTDYTLTQGVAKEVRHAGFDALLAPAATHAECRTLVVFKDKLVPPAFCILDPGSIQNYAP